MGSRSEASRLGALARLKTALLVAVAAVLGITVPVGGDALEVLITPLVIVLVYSSLRSVEIEDLHAGTIGPAAVSLLLSYVALPAAAIVVGTALLSRSAFLGCSPWPSARRPRGARSSERASVAGTSPSPASSR